MINSANEHFFIKAFVNDHLLKIQEKDLTVTEEK